MIHRLRRLTIRVKLMLIFLGFVVVFAGFSVLALVQMAEINDYSTVMEVNWLPSAVATATINRLSSDYRIAESLHVLADDRASMRMQEREMARIRAEIELWRLRYEPLVTLDEEQDLYDSFSREYATYLASSRQAIFLSGNGRDELAAGQLQESGELFDSFSVHLQELVDLNQAEAIKASQDGNRVYNRAFMFFVAGIGLTVLFGLFAVWLENRIVTSGLEQLSRSLRLLSQGRFDIEVPERGRGDEIGVLAGGVELFRLTAMEKDKLVAQMARAKLTAEQALKDKERAQSELIEAEKLASLGALVAGVAHEINTPVGNVLTAASHLEQETARTQQSFDAESLTASELEHYMDAAAEASRLILSNADRAARLIRGFKQVAVDQAGDEVRDFELCDYLEEVVRSMHPRLKKTRIEVRIDCPEKIELQTKPGGISQVVSNLIGNSLEHAYDEDGSGTIRIRARRLEQGMAELVYSDDGRGIDPQIRGRIFEPFVTTRRNQGGSGLGLSIVHNVVKKGLWGSIGVKSSPGNGTTFHIRFPQNLRDEETTT